MHVAKHSAQAAAGAGETGQDSKVGNSSMSPFVFRAALLSGTFPKLHEEQGWYRYVFAFRLCKQSLTSL